MSDPIPDWECPRCDELNDDAYESCSKCGQEHPEETAYYEDLIVNGDRASQKPSTASTVNELSSRLGDAMQAAWDDHCADTGNIPSCFESSNPRTKFSAHFRGSSFVHHVAELLEAQNPKCKSKEGK